MTNSILRWARDHTLPLLCSLGFATLSLWLAAPLLIAEDTPVLHMSAGPDSTRRHAIAVYMCEEAAEHNLTIKLEPNAGSEECLDLLKTGKLDAAIVSSGVKAPDDDDIKVLGAVQLEYVHLLVRKELADGDLLSETIRGKRVNLGEKGSTEWLLAREFLAFARLKLPSATQPGDVIPTEYDKTYLVNKARAILRADGARKDALIAELPDCLLVLATLPSTVVQQLVEAADYQIVPLPATRAFLLDNMQDSHARTTVLEREFLEHAVIPTGCYFTTHNCPETDCETVGARLLVVANKNAPARAIKPLMKTLFEGEFSRRIFPKSPRDLATSYAIHPAAVSYLDRDKPLIIEEAVGWISNAFSIFGAFSAGVLSLYGLLWKKKARKPSDYYAEIRKVDLIAQGAEIDASAPLQPTELVAYLDERLLKLRQYLIEDICEGRIKGDQVIANILVLLKDARSHLPKGEGAPPTLSDQSLMFENLIAKAA